MKKQSNKGTKEQKNKGTKEQRNKETKKQKNKGTKKQKNHPIGSGITRSPGLVFVIWQDYLYKSEQTFRTYNVSKKMCLYNK